MMTASDRAQQRWGACEVIEAERRRIHRDVVAQQVRDLAPRPPDRLRLWDDRTSRGAHLVGVAIGGLLGLGVVALWAVLTGRLP